MVGNGVKLGNGVEVGVNASIGDYSNLGRMACIENSASLKRRTVVVDRGLVRANGDILPADSDIQKKFAINGDGLCVEGPIEYVSVNIFIKR